jgi:hypothetical protein
VAIAIGCYFWNRLGIDPCCGVSAASRWTGVVEFNTILADPLCVTRERFRKLAGGLEARFRPAADATNIATLGATANTVQAAVGRTQWACGAGPKAIRR